MSTTTATQALNYGGVTGDVALHFTSATHAYVTTEGAHVNDSTPAVTYRGRRLLVGADIEWHVIGRTVEVTTRPHGCTYAPIDRLAKSRPATDSERAAIHNALLAMVTSRDFAAERNAAETRRLDNEWHASSRAVADAEQALAMAIERHRTTTTNRDNFASKGA